MEGKKLNRNQPFLTVRRPPIPYYRSELKSGPVGKKGAVPFHREQTPGNPREETTTTTVENKEAPKLPPCRYLDPTLQDLHQVPSNHIGIKASTVDNFENPECLNEKTEEQGDEDDDENYVDALDDTHSRTTSTFLNCSVSGVSKSEDSDVKPCRDFSRDPNMFAAKSMASDKPQYIMPKKPNVIRGELPKDSAKKMVIKKEEDRDMPSLRYGPSYANRCSYYYLVNEEFEEDKESEYGGDQGRGCLVPSVCGFSPRFCLKGSSGILNPVPGMSLGRKIAKLHRNKIRSRSLSNFSDPEMPDAFEPEICDLNRIDANRTDMIEATTGFEFPERVSKTFRQLLNDSENLGPEKVPSFDTITTVENRRVPSEALRWRDEGDRDREERVDPPSKDPEKLLHPVDTEIEPKISEILGKKYTEFVISAPPLPKSPSDSWLWRTLPSAHRHSNLVRTNVISTRRLNPAGCTMWEAIVKSSKQQHHHDKSHSHYPEETLTPLQKT